MTGIIMALIGNMMRRMHRNTDITKQDETKNIEYRTHQEFSVSSNRLSVAFLMQ
jgi:hypothetical protein